MADRLEIDDAVVLKLLRDPKYSRAFPFLATARAELSKPASDCSKCPRRQRQRTRAVDYNHVRSKLAGMSKSDKSKLLTLLGTRAAVIRFRQSNGQPTKLILSA